LRFKLILLFILGFFLLNFHSAQAQTQTSDSLKAVRKHVADSAAALRKYHSSKRYKDSVVHAKSRKAKELKATRKTITDSIKDARKHINDSLVGIRHSGTDSIKLVQNKRTDSLAKIKKYKGSKRFTDSVTIAKRTHTDSIKNVHKHFADSMARARKHTLDSAKLVRKHYTDSIKIVRTKTLDSVKLVRKHRADSLLKVKNDKLKAAKAKEKKANDSKNLKLEIKMKNKHEKFTNQSMLKKKWTPVRRFFQNSFTHYNYYYNANRKMEEANLNMLRGGRKENYDSVIGLYPFDPNKDSALLSADMDSIIRKVSVGVQIHDPRVKWGNDMYLLMGEAYYYKGRYENAATTFRYIISNDQEIKKEEQKGSHTGKSKEAPSIAEDDKSRLDFLKHKSVHNDAILWLARTYTQSKHVEFSEAVISLLASDPHLPEDLGGKIAEQKAFAYLAEENYTAASKQLVVMVKDNTLPDWLRMRAAFLNGQLLQNMGKHAEAAASFDRCLDFFPKLDMDFYARKLSSDNALMAGADVADAMNPLKKVLNDGKYVSYYDQVYYALGKLSLKANKPDDAIDYLTKSAETPKATKKQKALSFATLGDVYYTTGAYADAKRAYDSASKYAGTSSKDTAVLAAIQRSKGLNEISVPAGVIHDQDSLMALSELSKKEQQSAVRRYLRDLENKIADSIRNAEEASIAVINQPDAANDAGDAGNWYFSNPTTMQQGSADFKRKWGNRPLTDNWRRAAGAPLTAGTSNPTGLEEDNATDDKTTVNGLPSEESLLAKIPNTKAQKEVSAKLEIKAYILLAKAYIKQLKDYNQALTTLDTLDAKFPNHNEKEEELYLRYQCALKQNELAKAQAYSDEFLKKYPKSEYAALLRPKGDSKGNQMIDNETVPAYYATTYDQIMKHDYESALARVNIAKTRVDDPVYKKRFEIAEALAYAGQKNYNMADTIINKFIKTNPSDSLSGWATQISSFIKDMRKNGVPSWYYDTIAVDNKMAKKGPKAPKPAAPPKPKPPSDIPTAYTFAATDEHYCILVLPGLDSRTAPLKEAIKDINTSKGLNDSLNLLIDMYNTNLTVFIVKKFPDADQAKSYMNLLVKEQALKGYQENEVQAMVISTKNYKKLYADQEPERYQSFYNAHYK